MSTEKEATGQQTWECILQGKKKYGAYGSRDLLLIYQNDSVKTENIIYRRSVELTGNDQRELERLGLPPDQ